MILLSLAARNATRNLVRTALTASIVVFGTAFLVVGMSWINGVFGQLTGLAAAASGHVRVANTAFVKREDLMPLYENLPDTAPVVDAIGKLPGVQGVFPRITSGVTVTAGDEIGDVFGLCVGAPMDWYTEWIDLDAKIQSGRMLQNDDEIVLGVTLAGRVGAEIGTEIVLVGQTQDGSLSPIKGTVVGIAQAGNALFDQQAFVTLEKARYLVDMPGGATEVLVYGEDRNGAEPLRDAIIGALGPTSGGTVDGAAPEQEMVVQAWSDREPWRGFVNTGAYIQAWISGIIVFITALGVWNTMMMSVLERTGEIGVMRAMGLGKLGAVSLFVVEALAIALIGGVVGVMLGALPAYYWLELQGVSLGETVVQNLSIPFSNRMYADFSSDIAVRGFVLALAMALVGSALPAWHAASIQPVEAMRSKR